MTKEIYFDYAATSFVDPRVKKAMDKFYTDEFGNPGSFHTVGLRAKQALDGARQKVADILNCSPKEVVFTGSGTESINLALKGLSKGHIVTTKVEHHAVLHTCEYLEKIGYDVTYLDVDRFGLVSVEDVKKALRDDTVLVSVIYANNEIGSINPVKEIGELLQKYPKVVFHTDACQAAGLLDVDVKNLKVDLMTLNSSKVYGPKGVGLLYIKRGVSLTPLIHGGGQEHRLRSGTENVPGIVGFATALEIAHNEKEREVNRLAGLRDRLEKGVLHKVPKCFVNGHPTKRLPNNSNITFLDVEGEAVMLHLNEFGICASSGSACTSHTLDPSHVIMAVGLPYEAAHGSIRFSLGRLTTEEGVDRLLDVLPGIIKSLRSISPVKLELAQVLEGR